MYSTAGMNLDVRNAFGHVFSDGSLLSLLRMRSSNAAAPSVVSTKLIMLEMLVMVSGSSVAIGFAPALR